MAGKGKGEGPPPLLLVPTLVVDSTGRLIQGMQWRDKVWLRKVGGRGLLPSLLQPVILWLGFVGWSDMLGDGTGPKPRCGMGLRFLVYSALVL